MRPRYCRVRAFAYLDDAGVNNITVFWQNGQNGRWIQKPVNHVNDAIWRQNVGACQVDEFVAQGDLTLGTKTKQKTR